MDSLFKKLWKVVAAGGTLLAYQALLDRVKSKESFIEQKNQILEIKDEIKNVQELLNQSTKDDLVKKTIINKIEPLNNSIKELESFYNSWPSQDNKEQNIKNIDEFKDSYHREMGDLITKCHNRISDLEKFLKDNNFKFSEDNFISKLITEFKDYLSTLSIEQLCILIDFLLITLVFSCLITILFAFYGNFLIDKFSLEEKYPKLSVIIKLRRKFQHYYIITNSLIIIFALLFMGYVNLFTLLNGS